MAGSHLNIVASVEQRVDAIQARSTSAASNARAGPSPSSSTWRRKSGCRETARASWRRAWTDPAFRERLLANGRDAP